MSLENDKVLKELSELDLFLMTTLLTSSILKSICVCKSTSSVVVNDVNSAKCISGNDQGPVKLGFNTCFSSKDADDWLNIETFNL